MVAMEFLNSLRNDLRLFSDKLNVINEIDNQLYWMIKDKLYDDIYSIVAVNLLGRVMTSITQYVER